MAKQRVEVGQQRVPLAQSVTDASGRVFAEQPGLAPGGVQVRVAAEERVKGADLDARGVRESLCV
jgi:hypothetical protein